MTYTFNTTDGDEVTHDCFDDGDLLLEAEPVFDRMPVSNVDGCVSAARMRILGFHLLCGRCGEQLTENSIEGHAADFDGWTVEDYNQLAPYQLVDLTEQQPRETIDAMVEAARQEVQQ